MEKKIISMKQIPDNKKVLVTEDEYLNFRAVNYRLRLNREECVKLLKEVKEGYLNPEKKIDRVIELLQKDEVL